MSCFELTTFPSPSRTRSARSAQALILGTTHHIPEVARYIQFDNCRLHGVSGCIVHTTHVDQLIGCTHFNNRFSQSCQLMTAEPRQAVCFSISSLCAMLTAACCAQRCTCMCADTSHQL